MIAIDSNILLRHVLGDHKTQSDKATRLIRGAVSVLITDVVLIETVWTLKGGRYHFSKGELLELLESLSKEPNISFEHDETVWRALVDYRAVKLAGFADALIVNKARHCSETLSNPFEGLYTFDKAALKIPGAQPI